MTDDPNDNEKTGRGKPPKHRQFKKGVSGNPSGRPKGSKNLATLLERAAYEKVPIRTSSGKERYVSRLQLTIFQLANKAAKGEPKAMESFLDRMDEVEQRTAAAKPAESGLTDADRAILQTICERMKLCQKP